MARIIIAAGDEAPEIPNALQTFDSDFSRQNALTGGQWGPEGYTWLYEAKAGVRTDPGTFLTELRDSTGTWSTVSQIPYGIAEYPNVYVDQVTINNEIQYYVREHERTDYNLPVLQEIINGELVMYCRQTPDNFKDQAITSVDVFGDFPVLNVDEGAREITVLGHRYDRRTPSADGVYQRATYTGFDRFSRDELTGDGGPQMDPWKRRKYPYGLVRLQSQSKPLFKMARYDRVIDNPGTDPLGQTATTTHRIRFQTGQLTSEDWETMRRQDAVIKLYRRQPWIAPMKTTGGTFSQHYGIFEMEMKLADHGEQFFAWWMWGQQREMFSQGGFPDYNFDEKYKGATELDCVEWPGGGPTITRYHNIHAAGEGGMLGYAIANGIDPEMALDSPLLRQTDDNREWQNDLQAGHIINIKPGETGYVYYGDWFVLRVMWVPPNSPWNPRPIGVVRWYTGQRGQPLRYLCGVITPPWWDSNPGLAKQFFLNNAVAGDFQWANRYAFAVGFGSDNFADTMENRVSYLKAWQFPGYPAGGAGYPDENGVFSRGWLPTPNDPTGNSGTGIVQQNGEPGTGGTGSGGVGGGGGGTVDPPTEERVLEYRVYVEAITAPDEPVVCRVDITKPLPIGKRPAFQWVHGFGGSGSFADATAQRTTFVATGNVTRSAAVDCNVTLVDA